MGTQGIRVGMRGISDGIIFYVVLNISVVSVVSDKTIFHAVSKISVVIVVSDGIIFHVVLKISPITVVTGEMRSLKR